ncbi:hypothetical protein D0Y65_053215 [Glycine soja]|uniref:Uncharacterized protein n=1 Tax=Glycine soja TaxID=3848 RepID=A0A445F181_GLYSO|nr:hypothetical protein D0Y65_053215 [Glycine soja]
MQSSSDLSVLPTKILRMAPRTSLFQLEAEGQHYCEDHWDALKNQHNEVDYLGLLKYCFSSAYMLALLHDVLGIAMEEKRETSKLQGNIDIYLADYSERTILWKSSRSKINSDRLEEAITKLTTHQISLSDSLQHLTHKLDELIHHLHKPDTQPLTSFFLYHSFPCHPILTPSYDARSF